jgi:hypothetical protein
MSLFKSIGKIAAAPLTGGLSLIPGAGGKIFGGKDQMGLLGMGRPDVRGSVFEGDQRQLVDMLMQRAQGQGDSIAAMQAREAGERSLGNTMSAIQSVPGLSAALRARMAGRAQEEAGSDIARQETVARLAEQEGSQNALIQALASARGQDIGQEQMRVGTFERSADRRNKFAKDAIGGAAKLFGIGG